MSGFLELTKKKFMQSIAIDEIVLHDIGVERMSEWIADKFYISLKATLLGEDLQDIYIEYPATWWDGFKREVFPAWLKKKYPPKMVSHTIDIDAVLPKFAVALPEEQYNYVLSHRKRYWYDEETESSV